MFDNCGVLAQKPLVKQKIKDTVTILNQFFVSVDAKWNEASVIANSQNLKADFGVFSKIASNKSL